MPYKHRSDKSKNDASYYDLAPTKIAQSLPTKRAIRASNTTNPNTKSGKRKRADHNNDTPRAFTRLLGVYRPPRSGLDDGNVPSKKRKTSKSATRDQDVASSSHFDTPTIQPREPLSSFNARVDAALPFSHLSKRSVRAKDVGKDRKTKTEKKMQKMQKEWREEDRRRREKLEEEADEAIVNEDGFDELDGTEMKGGKRKKGGGGNGIERDNDDPWAQIKEKRIEASEEKSKGGLVGLHDVVLAPPKFSRVPKAKHVVGGLKRQVELGEARKNIVEGYRQILKGKRGN